MKTAYLLFFLVIIFSCNSSSASEQQGETSEKHSKGLSVEALDDQRLTATYANPGVNRGERVVEGEETNAVSTLDGEKLYTTYCAGCHGVDLSGNSATALIKTEWTYGRSKGLMNRNISYGIPGTDMAAFNQILSRDQIRNVVNYIHDSQGALPQQRPENIAVNNYADILPNSDIIFIAGACHDPWFANPILFRRESNRFIKKYKR